MVWPQSNCWRFIHDETDWKRRGFGKSWIRAFFFSYHEYKRWHSGFSKYTTGNLLQKSFLPHVWQVLTGWLAAHKTPSSVTELTDLGFFLSSIFIILFFYCSGVRDDENIFFIILYFYFSGWWKSPKFLIIDTGFGYSWKARGGFMICILIIHKIQFIINSLYF